MVWKYDDKHQILFKTIDQESLNNVIQILEDTLILHNKSDISHFDKSGFYKVIKGQRKQYLGWCLFFIYI